MVAAAEASADAPHRAELAFKHPLQRFLRTHDARRTAHGAQRTSRAASCNAECYQTPHALSDVSLDGVEPLATSREVRDAKILAGWEQVLHAIRQQCARRNLKGQSGAAAADATLSGTSAVCVARVVRRLQRMYRYFAHSLSVPMIPGRRRRSGQPAPRSAARCFSLWGREQRPTLRRLQARNP